ncbi:MAG: ATP-binding cassette domain-containing protein [Methanimicrococcus sp.]|nr:ATP-binding cassette domain-containing protein [Methanimicrococcus sp.]
MFPFKKSAKPEKKEPVPEESVVKSDLRDEPKNEASAKLSTAEDKSAEPEAAEIFENKNENEKGHGKENKNENEKGHGKENENSGEDSSKSSDIVFEAVDLSFSYPGGETVLKKINLKIYKGEYTIIAGLNGSGKSTFAYHLNALLRPTSGTMRVYGMDTKLNKHIPQIHRRVGIVFQNPYVQFVGNTVEEDIAFGPENLGLSRKEIRERVDNAMDAVRVRDLAFQDPSSLSGGEAQAAAIAGVLAMDPDCIVFDEVVSMLDYAAEERVTKIVDELRERGKTIVCITHEPKELLKADRVIFFEKGEVVFNGSAADYISSGKYRLPDIVKLMKRLREEGFDISESVWSPDKAADEIIAYFKTGNFESDLSKNDGQPREDD